METVYSLICWGGRTGKTVSISASTDVVTLTKHGVRTGMKLWPSGTLPGELNSSTPVYGRMVDINTFTLHTSAAGAIAGTGQITFAGTSTYAAVVLKSDLVASPSTALAAYGLSDLSRWGVSGSERIFDGFGSWVSGRSGANRIDVEVCEIGEAFTDIRPTQLDLTIPSSGNQIVTTINGKRTAGFHAGNFPKSTLLAQELKHGYIVYTADAPYAMLYMSRYRDFVDGIILMASNGSIGKAIDLGVQCRALNCIFYQAYTNSGSGITLRGALSEAVNNILVGWYRPLDPFSNQAGMRVMNNLVTKCYSPLPADNATMGFYYNNIIVGNTSDWPAQPTGLEYASNNFGPAGNAWNSTGGTRYTIATTDFADWANNDFRPASASSPQVDTGLVPYDGLAFDIANNARPSYKGGAATEIDGGPYEFDHGYGPWPASHALTLTNVVVGSRVFIRDQSNTTTHYDQIAASSTVSTTITVYGDSRDNWRIKVRNASSSPSYVPYETLMTATAGSSSLYVSQIPDE